MPGKTSVCVAPGPVGNVATGPVPKTRSYSGSVAAMVLASRLTPFGLIVVLHHEVQSPAQSRYLGSSPADDKQQANLVDHRDYPPEGKVQYPLLTPIEFQKSTKVLSLIF